LDEVQTASLKASPFRIGRSPKLAGDGFLKEKLAGGKLKDCFATFAPRKLWTSPNPFLKGGEAPILVKKFHTLTIILGVVYVLDFGK